MNFSLERFFVLFSFLLFFVILFSPNTLLNPVIAEEYDFVAGIHNEITFNFRDGVETVKFPIFSTTSDIVSNVGSSFKVEGVVGDTPHLHKALDEAYLHRMLILSGGASHEFDYRFFDVDVNVVQNEVVLKSFSYKHCEIDKHAVLTLSDDYESYMLPSTGFAIVDSIEFRCSGVHINSNEERVHSTQSAIESFTDYGLLPFEYAEEVRTFLTFNFDHGSEKIESVIFTLTSGFDEVGGVGPSFQIITAVLPHPLLDDSIEKSQMLSGMRSGFNEDFDVSVVFDNSEETLRGLDFSGCIVSGYGVATLRDGEEGYTGKRGFATAEIIDVDCSGLFPLNPSFNSSSKNTDSVEVNLHPEYDMGEGPHVIATFDFDTGVEVVSFPEFHQDNPLTKSNPTFQLVGVLDSNPLLYNEVDRTLDNPIGITGVNSLDRLFDVNLVLVYGDDVVRGFDYSKCHIVNYIVKTEHDSEESFYRGFALTNEFHFECLGYHPYDPKFDALYEISQSSSRSSIDYQSEQRSSWSPGFRYP